MAQGMTDMLCKLNDGLQLEKVDIRTYSPLSLAYIGDAVFDLMIRSYVVSRGNRPNNSLHRMSTRYVSAKAQAMIVDSIKDSFSDEEMQIYKRGHNAKPHSQAKNAALSEYLKATGFEALLGYLYLSEKYERISDIVKQGIDVIENQGPMMM